jgi:hypothetical protein
VAARGCDRRRQAAATKRIVFGDAAKLLNHEGNGNDLWSLFEGAEIMGPESRAFNTKKQGGITKDQEADEAANDRTRGLRFEGREPGFAVVPLFEGEANLQ